MAPRSYNIIVSACLAGEPCRWDGRSNLDPEIREMVETGRAVAACPELLGGLSIPREPSEIVGGGGWEVWKGKARVFNRRGQEVTGNFLRGAQRFLQVAREWRVRKAVLKDRSPSCGLNCNPDGTFSGRYRPGPGVTAALLLREGIEVEART